MLPFKSYTKAQIGTSVTRHVPYRPFRVWPWAILAFVVWIGGLWLVGTYTRPVLTSYLDSRRPSALVANASGDVFACDTSFSMSTPIGVVVGSSHRRGCK